MSGHKINLNREIIGLFSGQDSIVTTPKVYIQLTGSHSLAVVLNQAVYWSTRSRVRDGWFYKKYQEWFEEINIPERTLRRHFDKLEQHGWITTKVKKVDGDNIKHICPNTDRILESISLMLRVDCPDRPQCPAKPKAEQVEQEINPNACTEIAPTGHIGRSEPATLSDSTIYTDDYLQMNTTKLQVSSSFIFSESVDQKLLNLRHPKDTRSDDEFLNECLNHVDNHSDKQYPRLRRAHALAKLLTKLKKDDVIFSTKAEDQPEIARSPTNTSPYTSDELAIISEYKHALKMHDWGAPLETYMPCPIRREKAKELIARVSEKDDAKICPPEKNARRNSLSSASSLVSHLAL